MSTSSSTASQPIAGENLLRRYAQVRNFTMRICETLSAEDCTVQSMPDVSPTRWHLAHTTWFFETFILQHQSGYRPFSPQFAVLFNSYYNAVGAQFPRPRRGLLSRPSQQQVIDYRRHVDECVLQALERAISSRGAGDDCSAVCKVLELGLQHEQQHQELLLTDIKHVLSCNPLAPVFREGRWREAAAGDSDWVDFDEGLYEVGHAGNGFAYDNESPRHRVFLERCAVATRNVTSGEYIDFIEDGGYRRPELWLSEGWNTVQAECWEAPLYWLQQGGQWQHFTLAGLKPVDVHRPVCHISYFEAEAFARWAGYRLPTEAEWEVATAGRPTRGHFADSLLDAGEAIHPLGSLDEPLAFGDVWQWTASPYVAYPGYRPPDGALGEYNGKFMCNQFVLRGGSCATHSSHIRATYRNFFPPDARWQFSGVRLAK